MEAIEDISDQEQVQAEARAATNEVDRLTRRLEQVLALARSDAGEAPFEQNDASAIVRERVEAAQGMFGERGVVLDSRVSDGVVAPAPTGVLARIVDELLGNALQYARGRVEVTLTEDDRMAVLTVSDDGPGVPVDERDAVFERFRRGRASVPGGSGLGLALVRESVVGLGGSARADESRMGGLAVVVRIPRSDAAVDARLLN